MAMSVELIWIQVPLELRDAAMKLIARKKVKKSIARLLTPARDVFAMPNQPAPDKAMIALRVSRLLKARLLKLAKQRKMSLTDLVVFIWQRETKDVELTSEEVRKIAEEIAEAERGAKHDNRLRSNRAEG